MKKEDLQKEMFQTLESTYEYAKKIDQQKALEMRDIEFFQHKLQMLNERLIWLKFMASIDFAYLMEDYRDTWQKETSLSEMIALKANDVDGNESNKILSELDKILAAVERMESVRHNYIPDNKPFSEPEKPIAKPIIETINKAENITIDDNFVAELLGDLNNLVKEKIEVKTEIENPKTAEVIEEKAVENIEDIEELEALTEIETEEETIIEAKNEPQENIEIETVEAEIEDHKEEEIANEVETVIEEKITISVEKSIIETTVSNDLNTRLSSNSSASSLNESIVKKEESSLADKLQKQSLTDLSKSIGLNERFMFTKALFKSDVMAYTSSIAKLNQIKSLNEAQQYIFEELVQKYNWNIEGREAQLFIDLIEKRYN